MEKLLPKPTIEEVEKYLIKWDSLEDYVHQESSLDKVFLEVFNENKIIEDILIKTSVLNDFYSTNIFKIFPVAKHILKLDIDERLILKDPTLVNDIAKVNMGKSTINFYSFASKYCSHHYPIDYPIYDSYVEKVLMYFKKYDRFSTFKKDDLKDYSTF